jgi:septin family protein
VAGAKQTGKSSLLRLLFDTSTISPTNTQAQLASLSTYRSSSARPTTSINITRVEILQSASTNRPGPEDRINLTCIDTPGLDFSEGKEFALDRAVSSVVKYVDMQFAETMGEESKVVRMSKGDQHVHLFVSLLTVGILTVLT